MFYIGPETRIIALDLETTGLFPATHHIVEIAAVCWQNGVETGHFQTLVNPGCPMPAGVIRVHGITDDMLQDKPAISEVLPAFLDFCDADYLVAHNSSFDVRFLHAACLRAGLPSFSRPVLDSCSLARQRLPGCPNYRLDTLKAALGICGGRGHRALQDSRDCLAIFLTCMQPTPPVLSFPIPAQTQIPDELGLLREILISGGTVAIEYTDVRGRTTCREVRPLLVSEQFGEHILEAHCLLRDELRHFALKRIKRIWRPA